MEKVEMTQEVFAASYTDDHQLSNQVDKTPCLIGT